LISFLKEFFEVLTFENLNFTVGLFYELTAHKTVQKLGESTIYAAKGPTVK
jgi:hypothetical protein